MQSISLSELPGN